MNIDLELLANMATILEAVFVIFSVLLILRELRTGTKLTKAANSQALVEVSAPLNMELILNPEIAEFWISGADKYATMNEVDQYRYHSLLTWWLIMHENIYYQQLNGLLDKDLYAGWDHDLEQFVIDQKLWQTWDEMKPAYHGKFAARVTSLVEKYMTDNPANTHEDVEVTL